MNTWTREAVEALGPTTDVPTTAAIFDVGEETVYAQIRRGEWTATRVLRLGRQIRIPTRDLLELLYVPAAVSPVDPAVPSACNQPASPLVTAPEPHSQCGCKVEESAVIHTLRGA